LPIAYCLSPIAHCPLLIAHCLSPIAHCLLPIAHCLLPIAHCLLPIAHCLLLITYHLPLTTYHLPLILKPHCFPPYPSELCGVMKFSIGDRVLLKQTGEEGIVVSLISHEMVEVECGGIVFPVFMDEVEHPYLKWFLDKSKNNRIKPRLSLDDLPLANVERDQQTPSGFHLSFLPEFKLEVFDEVVDKMRVYFINQTAYRLSLQYECLGKNDTLFRHTTAILPFSHFYLHDIPFDCMHDQPRFNWRLQQNDYQDKLANFSGVLRIKPKKLFEYILRLQQENQPSFSIMLAEDFPKPEPFAPLRERKSAPSSKRMELPDDHTPIPEIDLHLDQLAPDTKGMTNFDMLRLQLQVFEQTLDKAIRLHQHSLVVIHGVGKGRLKEEIHSILRAHDAVSHFVHQWSPRYGMGATEIFFK